MVEITEMGQTAQGAKPKVYIFNNAVDLSRRDRYAIAEDGVVLKGNMKSKGFVISPELHQACTKHYPEGYELVILDDEDGLPAEVYALNQERRPKETAGSKLSLFKG